MARLRVAHEAINGKIKPFFVLSTVFPHDLRLHSVCFYAVLNLVCLPFEESPMWDV